MKANIKRIYKAANAAPFDAKKANLIGRQIESIEQRNNKSVTPLDIVEDARDRRSPLHDCFEWNDGVAAEKYRLWQARNIINHLVVEVKYDGKVSDQRAYISVRENDEAGNPQSVYVTLQKVFSNNEFKQQVLQNALEEISYWRDKYTTYQELGAIFRSIDITKKKIKVAIPTRRKNARYTRSN